MNLLDLIPLQYKIAIVAALVAAAGIFGYLQGYENGIAQYHTLKADVQAQTDILRADNERKLYAAGEATRNADEKYRAARRELDRLGRVIRVRPSRCEGAVPGLSATATGTTGLQASESGLGAARTITVEECEVRINGSLHDAIWIETVKQLTEQWHEVSK